VLSELNDEASGSQGGVFEGAAVPFLKDIGLSYQ